ncbi:MAG: hypothetical protein JO339_29905 [Alphaproteobacteria bacterium]|nr:hypothetical protein [Alphaproteobacteria bacterium]
MMRLLDEALASVAQGEQDLTHQRVLIAGFGITRRTIGKLSANGLLRSMEESQALRVAYVERLKRDWHHSAYDIACPPR